MPRWRWLGQEREGADVPWPDHGEVPPVQGGYLSDFQPLGGGSRAFSGRFLARYSSDLADAADRGPPVTACAVDLHLIPLAPRDQAE